MAGIEILIWEFRYAQRASGEMKCGENESKTEQKWKQQVMDQLLRSPTSRIRKSFLIACKTRTPQKTRYKLIIKIVSSFYESVVWVSFHIM
jgi:hypothetical protein